MIENIKKINFAQGKYIIPLIVYAGSLFAGYFVIDAIHFKAPEKDNGLETKESLNSKIPDANIRGDGIGKKYQSMLDAFGNIQDESVVQEAGEDSLSKEEYESKYSEAERDSIRRSREASNLMDLQKQTLEAQRRQQTASRRTTSTARGGNTSQEDATLARLQRELDQMRRTANNPTAGAVAQRQQNADGSNSDTEAEEATAHGETVGTVATKDAAASESKSVKAIEEDAPAEEVVKKQTAQSTYFNTISTNEKEKRLIKAIIDEDIKAVDNSRVRLRLLDELEIGDRTVPKGTYLYAIMSGFGGQRVKGTVSSLMLDEDLVKINLSIYDTDGLEGLYVPASDFRELSKDVSSGVFSSGGSSMFNGTSTGNNLAQMGMQALQNGYSKVTSAISKAIKKNRAHLKYGTVVYLVNSKEKKKDKKKNQ